MRMREYIKSFRKSRRYRNPNISNKNLRKSFIES